MTKPSSTKQSSLSKKIYNRHLTLSKKLNDTYIFINQAIPILEKEKKSYHSSLISGKDSKYFVPSIKKTKYAYRTDKELQNIYNRFIRYDLFKAILSSCISDFEDFLCITLEEILREYPHKINTSITGINIKKEINISKILLYKDIDSLINQIISETIIHISYLSPSKYFEYFKIISGVNIPKDLLNKYFELKASRDIIIHNNSKINNVYLSKSGNLARGKLNETLIIDQNYFDQSIALLKRISGVVRREIDLIY